MTDYVQYYDQNDNTLGAKDARYLAIKLRTEATITDGVIRWDSNGAVPPGDCLALAAHIGLPVDLAACKAASDRETAAFLADYRKRNRGPVSAEQRAEMRAAFGPGATVVNVVTGRRTRT